MFGASSELASVMEFSFKHVAVVTGAEKRRIGAVGDVSDVQCGRGGHGRGRLRRQDVRTWSAGRGRERGRRGGVHVDEQAGLVERGGGRRERREERRRRRHRQRRRGWSGGQLQWRRPGQLEQAVRRSFLRRTSHCLLLTRHTSRAQKPHVTMIN